MRVQDSCAGQEMPVDEEKYGFLVWNDIREQKFSFRHYRLQTKIVLVTSVVLVLLPALWIQLFELPELSAGRRLLPALFQSVTLRTAGFNTVDLNLFSDSGQAMMIIWMLIGTSRRKKLKQLLIRTKEQFGVEEE